MPFAPFFSCRLVTFGFATLWAGGAFLPAALPAADYPAPYTFTTLAGGPGNAGHLDGNGSGAAFYSPRGIAVDAGGNTYVTDTGNGTIRKISAGGQVSTLAGTPLLYGDANGPGPMAQFDDPNGIAVDTSGNLYVADTRNAVIRKIDPSGSVTTWAGTPGVPGYANGAGTAAQFYSPEGVALDGAGNLYVADAGNHAIRKITPQGAVSTLLGGEDGSANGSLAVARVSDPTGIAVDAAGNIYVADTGNATVRKISTAGMVTTIGGTAGIVGAQDGGAAVSTFWAPSALAVDAAGNVFVVDTQNQLIRKIDPAGTTSTVAGIAGESGSGGGSALASLFNQPLGIAVDSGGNLYVGDTGNNLIRKIVSGAVYSLAGVSPGPGHAEGSGVAARFYDPTGIAVGPNGNTYVADRGNSTIRMVSPQGKVVTFAGSAGNGGFADGVGAAAQFLNPYSVAVDGGGNVYVADTYNYAIRSISPAGVVSTVAGAPGIPGTSDGTGNGARFASPDGIAVDSAKNLYVTDANAVRMISPLGVVTTVAGTAATLGHADGAKSAASFNSPYGIAVAADGTIYVADTQNDTIRKIAAGGVVSTVAGTATVSGDADGTGASARFTSPTGLAVDSAGNLFVSDATDVIREITPGGVVTSLAGSPGAAGSIDGSGADAKFDLPFAVALDGAGQLLVADASNNSVRLGIPSSIAAAPPPPPTPPPIAPALNPHPGTAGNPTPTPTPTPSPTPVLLPPPVFVPVPTPTPVAVPVGAPVFTQMPVSQTVAVQASVTFSVVIAGSPSPALQWEFNGHPLGGATDDSFSIAAADVGDAGSYTVVATNANGTAVSAGAVLAVQTDGAPLITAQPQSQTIDYGSAVVFTVNGSGAIATASALHERSAVPTTPSGHPRTSVATYQWYFNGVPIPEATRATLVVGSTTYRAAGTYRCLVGNAEGSSLSNAANLAVVSVAHPGRLVNISTRGMVRSGGDLMIAGFVTRSFGLAAPEPLLVRASGPALAILGVNPALADPQLALLHGSLPLESDLGWGGRPEIAAAAASVGAFSWGATGTPDSAILTNLAAGSYTAQVGSASNGAGLALVEVYDATTPEQLSDQSIRLVNISTRAFVGTGGNIMIAGFVIEGSTSKTVLLRASGPALASFGVAGVIPDPKLTLLSGQSVLASNASWGGDLAIATVAGQVGAFPWTDPTSADSAVLITLPPGGYTAEVVGAAGDTGVALIEVYDVP